MLNLSQFLADYRDETARYAQSMASNVRHDHRRQSGRQRHRPVGRFASLPGSKIRNGCCSRLARRAQVRLNDLMRLTLRLSFAVRARFPAKLLPA